MFLHREDMQPFDTHGKEGVDMIVQTDTVECENAGSDSLLAARTHTFDGDTKQRVYRIAAETTGVCSENSDSHVVVVQSASRVGAPRPKRSRG